MPQETGICVIRYGDLESQEIMLSVSWPRIEWSLYDEEIRE